VHHQHIHSHPYTERERYIYIYILYIYIYIILYIYIYIYKHTRAWHRNRADTRAPATPETRDDSRCCRIARLVDRPDRWNDHDYGTIDRLISRDCAFVPADVLSRRFGTFLSNPWRFSSFAWSRDFNRRISVATIVSLIYNSLVVELTGFIYFNLIWEVSESFDAFYHN